MEGYTESAASGIMAGINLDRVLSGEGPVLPPPVTMLGGLYRYLREADPEEFPADELQLGTRGPSAGTRRGRRRNAGRRSPSALTAVCRRWTVADEHLLRGQHGLSVP